MEISATVQRSRLWQQTLAQRDSDDSSAQRDRLRSEFIKFRERASLLTQEIRKDIPDLTVHDATHLDALWEISSIITGENIKFTATEGFVLGGAILLHDTATSIAATPGGYNGLITDHRWRDIVCSEYRSALDRDPTETEIETPEPAIRSRSLFKILRLTHAQNAESLALRGYSAPGRGEIFLIDDPELRHTFGRLIGQIAHSHWWSLSEVKNTFHKPPIGAPHWCPAEWTVNPLKIACALRTADAAHLDARRAPMFLRSISQISASSDQHWTFQQKINKPYIKDDALIFSSGAAFDLKEASAWWLCLENLRMVDRELRGVDTLFADIGEARFAGRRVAGVDSPDRIISHVQTDGWLPINATVHVTDLPRIIQSIGGDALYGQDPHVALRELIQNSRDAIMARRLHEKRGPSFGAINVSLNKIEDTHWLEVTDDGIGMSQRVLTDFLLDFGKSFWGSHEMMEEFPGLLSAGMSAVGGFGIGFFSVFMIGDQVEVISRKAGDAARDTLVLQFGSGLAGRPILRQAKKSEQLIDGGTKIRIRLKCKPDEPNGFLRKKAKTPQTLATICRQLAPAIDVDLYVTDDHNQQVKIIAAKDWIDIDGAELLLRVNHRYSSNSEGDFHEEDKIKSDLRRRAGKNLRLIRGPSGEVFGRACISVGHAVHFATRSGIYTDIEGVVTVGGLKSCTISGICGILSGQTKRASRDTATPIVSAQALKEWAEEQADLIPELWPDPENQAACAQYIRLCGGKTGRLPIAMHKWKWINAEQIAILANSAETLVLIDHYEHRNLVDLNAHISEPINLNNNVIVTSSASLPGFLQSRSSEVWPQYDPNATGAIHKPYLFLPLGGAIAEIVAQVWGKDVNALLEAFSQPFEQTIKVGTSSKADLYARAVLLRRSLEPDNTNH